MNLLLLAFLAFTPNPQRPIVNVTSEMVCEIQHAIRFRNAAWAPWMCVRVADAMNAAARATGQRADTLLAIAINESDLRPHVANWHRDSKLPPGRYGKHGEIGPGSVGDLGLMGIRCKLGPDMLCSNGKLRGLKYPQVMVIETNVLLGARILASKPTLNDYNGGDGYAARICVIRAALGGAARPSASARVRKLIAQIVAAVRRLREL